MHKLTIYAGIGSREIPKPYYDVAYEIGRRCGEKGYTLRSGAANGSDTAFELGHGMGHNGLKEIYLPWKYFNKNESQHYLWPGTPVWEECMEMAARFHPAWHKVSDAGKKLHARNCQQIFGKNPISNPIPVKFVVCYTENGEMKGGTAQALRIANEKGILVFNIGKYSVPEEALVRFPY